jgi:hypothetical protein
MQHVTPDALLRTWELGMADPRPGARSRALLGAACPDRSESECGALSVGERDARLLALRERLFGSQFAGWVACPRCRHELELRFAAADVRSGLDVASRPVLTRSFGGYLVRFKAPSVDDIDYIDPSEDAEQQHARLLERIVVEASRSGQPCAGRDLPEDVVAAIESTLEESDVEVATELGVTCEACGHQWSAPFDIASYLWKELERWAVRLLWEVHALARAYAWKESDLILMSPWRRQRYLEMLAT